MNLLYNILITFSIAEIPFVIDILNHKYLNYVVMFHCYDNKVTNNIHRLFNEHDIRISTVKIGKSKNNVSPYFRTRSAIIIDSACEGWSTVLNSSTISFQNYSFIVFSEMLPTTTEILSHYPIQVDSEVTVAYKTNYSRIDLYEVYNTGFHFNGTFNVVKVGFWKGGSLFLKASNRKNLQGLRIRLATVILPTPKVVNETVEQHLEKARTKVDTVHRIKFFILLKYMRDMYNISYDMHRSSSWGYQRNGSFDGMVGALRHGMADIGGAPCFFRIDRAENVHYISEVWMSRHCFIFRHPKHPGGFYKIYTRPLSNIVWCCVVALLVVTAVVTWLMLRMQGNRVNGQDSSFSLAGLVIWGAVCQQGMFIRRESTSVKLATFVTFVYAVTLYQYYNATIVSSLLMEPPRNIRTLKDLLDSDLKVGADEIVYNMDYFKRTTDPVAIELYKRKIHTSTHYNFFTPETGMALVKKGGFALHIDTSVAFPVIKETFKEREICETQMVQMYPLQKCGVVIRKNAPYKEHISYGIRKMYEAGLLHRIRAVTDVPMPECAHTPDASVFSVNIREFSTPLLALTFGILCSLIIFLGEVLLSRILKNRALLQFRL
ncbi:ionotropic receptor 75a-like [Anticarsia gemmatalis]|uniref:ionotropic receptor 75a-like n=1 Tax=Anticarsia gemmatalis TaxID=129554 RepID=UPI003F766B19